MLQEQHLFCAGNVERTAVEGCAGQAACVPYLCPCCLISLAGALALHLQCIPESFFVGLIYQKPCLACRSCRDKQLSSSAVLADKQRLQSIMSANIGASGALSVRSQVLLVRAVTDRSSSVRTLSLGSRAPAC